jgi:hypothetical protein
MFIDTCICKYMSMSMCIYIYIHMLADIHIHITHIHSSDTCTAWTQARAQELPKHFYAHAGISSSANTTQSGGRFEIE